MHKQDRLLAWMKEQRVFATHDVNEWGVLNSYNRADRTKREFVNLNIIRKLDEDEKKARGHDCIDDVYEYVGAGSHILGGLSKGAA